MPRTPLFGLLRRSFRTASYSLIHREPVDELLDRLDERRLTRLAERADGVPFEEAVQAVTGRSVLEFERDFWAQQTAWRRWIPVMTSSTIIWVAIMLVAWAAFRKQRQRASAVKRQWEKEEEQP